VIWFPSLVELRFKEIEMSKRKVSLKLVAFKRDNEKVFLVESAKNTLEFTPGTVLKEPDVLKILNDRHPVDKNYVDDVTIVPKKDE
jgi:hypothetical protein